MVQSCRSKQELVLLAAIRAYSVEPLACSGIFVEAELAGDFTSLGWGSLVQELDVQRVHTDHNGLVRLPYVREVAALIMREIKNNRV